MPTDRFGYALTTTSDEAAAHYGRAVACMLSANFGADDALEAALNADPDFALALIAKARWRQVYLRIPEARAGAAAARALRDRVTPREARHIEIIALALEGAGAQALALLDEHLAEFPRDELPLFLALGAFGLLGFSGRRDNRQAELAMLKRLAPAWDEDWFFLTFLGWARIETGDVAAGIAEVERALSLNPRNAWGAHALAHGYHEAGNAEAGAANAARFLPDYDRRSQLHGHLSWHLALFELERGNTTRAHEVYADAVQLAAAHGAPQVIKLSDPAAFLWRCHIYGEALPEGDNWREVVEFAHQTFPHAAVHFADLHAVVADAAIGDTAAAEQRIAEMRERLASGRLPHGEVVPVLGEGIVAFTRGDYSKAADLIGPMLSEVPRVGGSGAQREVFEDTYIAACLRAGRDDDARERLAERLGRRPSMRDQRWLASIG